MPCPKRCSKGTRCVGSRCVPSSATATAPKKSRKPKKTASRKPTSRTVRNIEMGDAVHIAAMNAVRNEPFPHDFRHHMIAQRLPEKFAESVSSNARESRAANGWLSRYTKDPFVMDAALKFLNLLWKTGQIAVVYKILQSNSWWTKLIVDFMYSQGLVGDIGIRVIARRYPVLAAILKVNPSLVIATGTGAAQAVQKAHSMWKSYRGEPKHDKKRA